MLECLHIPFYSPVHFCSEKKKGEEAKILQMIKEICLSGLKKHTIHDVYTI